MSISLDLYRIFVAVAKNKSFSSAAKELFITQPAVSQAIKHLETTLQTQLFVRTAKGVLLTESGEILLGYAENALDILDTGERRFEELRSLKGGTLRIGGGDTLCRYYLLPYLSLFHQRYPDIGISVTNRTSRETAELLETGKVDIGFVNLPLVVSEDIEIRTLMSVQDCFVYGKRYFDQFNEKGLPLSELENHIILMLEEESISREYVDQALSEFGIHLHPQIELGSLDLLLEFAAAGLGIAVVLQEYANSYLREDTLRVLKVSPPLPKRHVGMIYHKTIPLSFAAQAFREMLLEEKVENLTNGK